MIALFSDNSGYKFTSNRVDDCDYAPLTRFKQVESHLTLKQFDTLTKVSFSLFAVNCIFNAASPREMLYLDTYYISRVYIDLARYIDEYICVFM